MVDEGGIFGWRDRQEGRTEEGQTLEETGGGLLLSPLQAATDSRSPIEQVGFTQDKGTNIPFLQGDFLPVQIQHRTGGSHLELLGLYWMGLGFQSLKCLKYCEGEYFEHVQCVCVMTE